MKGKGTSIVKYNRMMQARCENSTLGLCYQRPNINYNT